jgi:helicase
MFQSARDLLSSEKSGAASSARRTTGQDERLDPTPLGTRVSELYLDPATAHHLLVGMKRAHAKPLTPFGLLHLCASCLELRPYCTVKAAETPDVEEKLALVEDELLALAPSRFSEEHEEFLDTIKTAMVLESWIEEEDEERIMERYGVRPGELHAKKELLDWIIYAASELAGLAGERPQRAALLALRVRVAHGAKEELLPLLRLKGIGRVRARALFRAGVKDVAGLQRMDATSLGQVVGKAVALSLKEQVGQKLSPEDIVVKAGKRKGQKALGDWRGDGTEIEENDTQEP